MRFCALFLVAVACLAAETKFNFKAGVNFTDLDDFKARAITTITTGNVFLWTSSAVSGSVLNKSVDFDVVAAGFVSNNPLGVYLPFAFGAYAAGSATFNVDIQKALIEGNGMGQAAAGAIGFTFPGVVEFDKDHKPVAKMAFTSSWTLVTPVNVDNKEVQVFETSFVDQSKGKAKIYLVSSKVPGFIQFANTPVSPNTLEVIFELDDYKYQNSGNHLELIVATATINATGEGNFTGNATYRKSGDDILSYVALRGEATIDNRQAEVTISGVSSVDVPLAIDNVAKNYIINAFKASANANVDVAFDYKLVSFPANAKKIVYDPAIGSGVNVYSAPHTPDAASHIVISVLALILALFLLF